LRYVGQRGNPRAPICFVGEAPGAEEEASGLPFVGYSGKLLNMMISSAGLSEADCWFTNVYKVKPPDTVYKNNDLSKIDTLGVPLELFHDALTEELSFYKPPLIVACGRTALSILCPNALERTSGKFRDNVSGESDSGESEGFAKFRGSLLKSPLFEIASWSSNPEAFEHYVIPMYHPAFVLRNYAEKELSVLVLGKVADELHTSNFSDGVWHLNPLPQRRLRVEYLTANDVCGYIQECITQLLPISIDIETSYRKKVKASYPNLIALAKSPTDAISFNLWEFTDADTVSIFRLLDKLFSTKIQIGQNYTCFDAPWLNRLGFNLNRKLFDDTLTRHHVLWPSLPHKLEFQTFQYTREPYYKDEGKAVGPKGQRTARSYKIYNAKDAAVTYEIWQAQDAEFQDRATSKTNA
jgi:uracil-DNA glycosylase family 4